MDGLIFEDVRRMVLGLLFVIAFGWMAAHLVPGGEAPQQLAAGGGIEMVSSHPGPG